MELPKHLREKKVHPVASVIGGLLLGWAVYHTYYHRTLNDFWNHGKWMAIVIGTLLVLVSVVTLYAEKPTPSPGVMLFVLVMMFGVTCFLTGALYVVGVSLLDLFTWGSDPSTESWSWRASVSVLVLVDGSLLFYVRFRWRSLYGLSEAAVGLVISFEKIFRIPNLEASANSEFLLAILTASVYLVVRGFDNVHQGLKDDPPSDSIAGAFVALVRRRSRPD